MPDPDESGGGDTFASKLSRLFKVVHKDDGGTYSVAEVATAVGVSRQHVYDLLSGKKQRPAWDLVTKLADVFGVSVVYFGGGEEAERYASQLDLLAALGTSGVRDIAMRSGQLTPEHRGLLAGMLDHLQSLEEQQKSE